MTTMPMRPLDEQYGGVLTTAYAIMRMLSSPWLSVLVPSGYDGLLSSVASTVNKAGVKPEDRIFSNSSVKTGNRGP